MAPTISVMYILFCHSFSPTFLSFSSTFLCRSSFLCLSPSGISSSLLITLFFPLYGYYMVIKDIIYIINFMTQK